jgi:hypothetical protein
MTGSQANASRIRELNVREEIPFFTGRRRSISEILATLPWGISPIANAGGG